MEKETKLYRVQDLAARFSEINFPEYQREPNIWTTDAKRKLIDSMMRRFDIASLYFYRNKDGSLDCIDGRQRISAIMAFLNKNPGDDDNGFRFQVLNEIYSEEDAEFASIDGLTFEEIEEHASQGDPVAFEAVHRVREYLVSVVLLSDAGRPEEFNLQFTRLNLGLVINAGEKLHAMVGGMRDLCFEDSRIGKHQFLDIISIPTRRYAKEQVAAQIMAQVVSLSEGGEFARTRHFDLQRFFKERAGMDLEDPLVDSVKRTFDFLAGSLAEPAALLRNRALTVSTVLLAWERRVYERDPAEQRAFAEFVREFLCRLKWQIGKGLEIDAEYRYLVDFQRHVTQASVEKPAVEARAKVMREELERWLMKSEIGGDAKYRSRESREPSEVCREEGGE